MSRDQRVQDNHALRYAQDLAIEHGVPLYVLFVFKQLPSRSREQYAFMLRGLEEVAESLKSLQIPFVMRSGEWSDVVGAVAAELDAGALVCDFSPLNTPRQNIDIITSSFTGMIAVVDTHNIVPVWVTSDKQEFAAHTIRRKLHKHLAAYLEEPQQPIVHPHGARAIAGLSFAEADALIAKLPASGIHIEYQPGENAAKKRLAAFLSTDLASYAQLRNDVSVDRQSGLSPYLHFGQLSSLRVVLDCMSAVDAPPLLLRQPKMPETPDVPSPEAGMNALFEELIVRKELSDNFCFYNSHYRSLHGAPSWALKTLEAHSDDPRDFLYTKDQWEQAHTHDPVWNAAQTQLARTGKMHGYMRMYWAKKLLEWSASPAEALEIGIYLNDKYSIDGGDPNGYVGLLWSIAGLHDRPWAERSVFGMIRYMNAVGLQRKFDLRAYTTTWLGH
jgi:deoxyribodipyrimidine photo-lyase